MPARIAIASLMQESNSFSPLKTTVETFASYYLLHGEEMLTGYGEARTEVPGFFAVLAKAGAEAVPLIAAYAAASGTVTRQAFDTLVGEMERRLRDAGPVDGLLLALHGALVVEDQPDGDGEIIQRMRKLLPAATPIGVSLDLHGHITPLKLQPNVFHIGYREYPHIDMYETGQRTAEILLDIVAKRRPMPAMALAKRPLLVSPVCTRTTDGPLRPIAEEARRMERAGEVIHAALFPVQPWIDVPDLGFAALVCAEDAARAQAVAEKLAEMIWRLRSDFFPDLTPLEEAIRIGLASDGMTLVSDAGDAPTGGSAADSAAVLRALIAAGADRAARLSYLTICDPGAVAAASAQGAGAEVTTPVGHYFSKQDGAPVTITGRVLSLSDGIYKMTDGGPNGLELSMGLTAVIAIGSIRLLARSQPSMEWDKAMYVSQGLPLEDAALVFVKSPAHFRQSFGPLAARIISANTPGPTAPDMRRIPFTKATRPLYPLDPI
ncbi:M81 family metallopeptidase [Nordella sp. HKS 07]|uniref:M81 family metallopeptidase n=1 Tax=Nordella sp. HKS 07 TaxID=2712222 RepID=UPI0013E1257F|nr:M81 family metallopeptidase [Nordella sp. HKS 07]QIG49338.1 M81 family metallopeptidase [Nordella sp. HKS 07]